MMQQMSLAVWMLVVVGACVLGSSCKSKASCVQGQSVECPCPGGTKGAQLCTSDGVFAPCACAAEPATAGAAPSATPGAGATAGGSATPGLPKVTVDGKLTKLDAAAYSADKGHVELIVPAGFEVQADDEADGGAYRLASKEITVFIGLSNEITLASQKEKVRAGHAKVDFKHEAESDDGYTVVFDATAFSGDRLLVAEVHRPRLGTTCSATVKDLDQAARVVAICESLRRAAS